jgi:transcriptional regulator with XRE-family HTH domain
MGKLKRARGGPVREVDRRAVGDRIFNERMRLGWTRARLARELGHCADTSVTAYETGGKGIGLDVLLRLADIFGCSLDYLLCFTDVRAMVREVEPDTAARMALIRELAAGTSLDEVRRQFADRAPDSPAM